MQYINLGKTGLKVSRICLGTFQVIESAVELAKQRGVTPAQIAIAWLLHQPGVTAPIIGASKMEHLQQAVAALEVKLAPEERASLEAPYKPHPVLGHS